MAEKKFDDFTAKDTALFKRTSLRGSVAVFLYSRNVYSECKTQLYDENNKNVRAIAKSGVTYIPVSTFSRFLSVKLTEKDGKCELNFGENTLVITEGEKSYTLNGKTGEFDFKTERITGHIYVPAVKTARMLGIAAKSYNEDLLTIFGEDGIATLDENPQAVYAGGYLILGDYDKGVLTPENMKTVKDKWRAVLVGDEKTNDVSNPEVAAKLEAVADACKRQWNRLNRAPDRYILFGDKRPADSVDLLTQYSALSQMAHGYAAYGSEYYHNEDLKRDILDGLEWMYENMYGENEINECSNWRSAKEYDWWHWYVGGVEPLLDCLLLLEEHIPMETVSRYLRCFRYVMTLYRVGTDFLPFAMSRIRVCTRAGLLLEDADMIYQESQDYDSLLGIGKTEEGTRIDYVFWTHQYPYNMMYGLNNLGRLLYVGAMLGGTELEFTSPRQYRLFNMARYTFEAACYQGRGFAGFNGRGIGGKEISSGVSIANGLLPMLGLFGEDEDAYLKRMIKRYCAAPEFREALKARCSLYYFSKLMDILNDDSVSSENDFDLTHAWFTADRVAQHRHGYAFMLCMPSSRHPNYESIDEANRCGWYTCDGSLYLYTGADYHAFDGAHFIANERIAYRIPGVTADEQKRRPWAFQHGWMPKTDFTGCMQIDKKYAVGAFDYEPYHFESHENDDTTDGGYGGKYIFHENDLRAKKAYFFFDKEAVCLGAGITSTMNSPVNTTLEHRRLVKDSECGFGLEDVTVDGEIMPKSEYEKTKSGARWASLEGVGAYVFLENADVYFNKYSVKGEMKVDDMYFVADPEDKKYEECGKPYFELGIAHGKNPEGASYAYAILPYVSDASAYSAAPEVEIISNTADVQAVRKPSCGITFYVFHSRGACEEIEVSEPCIVAVKSADGEYMISVCDPTHKLEGAVVKVNKKLTLTEKARQLEVSCGDVTEIKADFIDSVGENFTAVFQK